MAYKDKIESFFQTSDTRSVWQGIQAITGYKPKNKNMCVENETMYANDLNEFYSRFDKYDSSFQQDSVVNGLHASPYAESIVVNESEVQVLFKRLNTRKAHGPDSISCRVLNFCAEPLASPFRWLFQESLNRALIPALWKRSVIVPVQKNAHPKVMNDLRPVALTSVPMKCLENIVKNRLNN